MNLKYKPVVKNGSFLSALITVGTSLLFCVCCIPSFSSIGHFVFQILTAAVLSFACTAVLFLVFKASLKNLSDALISFLIIMILLALYQQIKAQLSLDVPFSQGWLYTFYYDKPLTVALVWGVAFLTVTLFRLITPFNADYEQLRLDYSSFLNKAIKGFLVYYVLVLIYSFVLQRAPNTQSGLNLIPFNMIMSYINSSTSAYERLFYFTGNFICFFPFGFIFAVSGKEKELFKTILLPIILSLIIEVSQIILKNGYFDVDDILLNSLGFYFGFGITFVFDKIRSAVTDGAEKSIF